MTNTVKLTKVKVLFNHNNTMAEGVGNTRKQAERNASINGLTWLRKHKLLAEDAAASSGMGVHHNPIEPIVPIAFDATRLVVESAATAQAHPIGDDIEMTNEQVSDNEGGEEETKQ